MIAERMESLLNENTESGYHSMEEYLSLHQIPMCGVFASSMAVGLILSYNNLWHLQVASNTRFVLLSVAIFRWFFKRLTTFEARQQQNQFVQ